MSAITRAVENYEGGQVALARKLKVTPQAVNQWVTGRRPVSPRLAIAIEAETGISRHELLPKVFGAAPKQLKKAG